MKLYYAPSSPYVKKVLACAIELGLDARIECLPCPVPEQDEGLRVHNPLGKIPTLLADDGAAVFDSPAICRYLAALAPGAVLYPASPDALARSLGLEALGDGIVDACQLWRKEKLRPEAARRPDTVAHQRRAVLGGLDHLELRCAQLDAAQPCIGELGVATALDYVDFRFAEESWREGRPRLAAWYAQMLERPSMRLTRLKPVDAGPGTYLEARSTV